MRLIRLLLATLGACALLGALTSSASAGRFSVSTSTWRATFTRINFSGGLGTVECELTVEASLHSRTIPKVFGTLIGNFTGGLFSRCSRGGATVLAESIPWNYRYGGFFGRLPNVTVWGWRWINFSARIREPVFGITCLFTTEEEEPATVNVNREAGGRVTSLTIGGEIETSCGIAGTLSGTSSSISPPFTLTLI